MSLCHLIDSIEAGTFQHSEDQELSLAVRIQEELAAGEENEARKKLFGDARHLANHIIQRYLALDQVDRQKLADTYDTEECFNYLGAINNKKRNVLSRNIGINNLQTLILISNYSKVLPILLDYIEFLERTDRPNFKNSRLCGYFNNKGLLSVYRTDLSTGHALRDRGKATDSLCYGLPDDLKKRLTDVSLFIPHRTKLLENYIKFVTTQPSPKPGRISLRVYLQKGGKGWYLFDFRTLKKAVGEIDLISSLTYQLPESLKERVLDASSLLEPRKRILKNYIIYCNHGGELPLFEYLRTHDLVGNLTGRNSAASLSSYVENNFVLGRRWKVGERRDYVGSLSYRINDKVLVKRVEHFNNEYTTTIRNGGLVK